MIYIVSGHMRSGTTMLMKALDAGGMWTHYSNDNYEIPDFNFDDPSGYEDGVVKLLSSSPTRLPDGEYRVIIMRRNVDDIASSKSEYTKHPVDINGLSRSIWRDIEEIKERDDMEVLEVWYEDICSDPEEELGRIKEFGFPIDISDAAKVIIKKE